MKKQKENQGVLTVRRASLHYVLVSLLLLTASTTIYGPETNEYAQAATYVSNRAIPTGALEATVISTNVGIVQASYMQRKIEELETVIEQKNSLVLKVKLQGEAKLEDQLEKYETVDALIEKLYTYVGKTPYALSGSTPKAWDCSGLTLWFYERYKGITLHHSASTQAAEGKVVDAPIPGDIVAFYHSGRKSAFHVGIYVGGGRFIHAKNYSADTVLETVDGFAQKNIKVAYIRY
jgi:cell wall-associated NlpC family hydrolase